MVKSKQQKIQQILAIMSGKLNPSDLPDTLLIKFENGQEVAYLINKKPVSKEVMHATMRKGIEQRQSSVDPNFKTIGRDNDMEEYYL